MKKSTIEKIEKEINEKTKLPNEVKEKIKKEVFTNITVASVIILYFIFIILGSVGSIKNVRTIDLNIFSILFLGIAIAIFEISYRKDDAKLAMYGIESLVVAIFTLFLPYIIFELNGANKKYYLLASIYIASYYILKSIVISIKTKNKHLNSNISDVKEIVKKEKTKRRIKEEIEEIEIKNVDVHVPDDSQKNRKINNNKLTKDNIETEIKGSEPKKRGRPKNTQTTNKEKKDIKETTPKKRGRPKKSEKTKAENKQKIEDDAHIDLKPKKRGRPRKVAINND